MTIQSDCSSSFYRSHHSWHGVKILQTYLEGGSSPCSSDNISNPKIIICCMTLMKLLIFITLPKSRHSWWRVLLMEEKNSLCPFASTSTELAWFLSSSRTLDIAKICTFLHLLKLCLWAHAHVNDPLQHWQGSPPTFDSHNKSDWLSSAPLIHVHYSKLVSSYGVCQLFLQKHPHRIKAPSMLFESSST